MDLRKLVLQNRKETVENLEHQIKLHAAAAGSGDDLKHTGGIQFNSLPAGDAAAEPPEPSIQLASLNLSDEEQFLDDIKNVDPDTLDRASSIRLYAIIYATLRPGPAFLTGHKIGAPGLQPLVSHEGPTWQAYLDELNSPVDGVTWSERIALIARQCVRLDPMNAEQAGSGFLIDGGRILTAGHVISGPGRLFGNPPTPHLRPGRVLYNRIHSANPPEAGMRATSYRLASPAGLDVAEVLQEAQWQQVIQNSLLADEFSMLAGLELQTEPMVEDELRGRPVAVIGHPLRGNAGGSDSDSQIVYADGILGMKRFMPGFLDSEFPLGRDGLLLKHDCSTLGGASGSCLLDLFTGKVLGIHVAGTVSLHNYAVPIWRIGEWLDATLSRGVTSARVPVSQPVVESPTPMGARRVIAFAMHEDEMNLAERTMDPATAGKEQRSPLEASSNFVMGDATEEEIALMLEAGLEVQELPQAAEPEMAIESPASTFTAKEAQHPQPYLLRVQGPLTHDRLLRLDKLGVTVQQPLPSDHILATLAPAVAGEVAQLHFVIGMQARRAASEPLLQSLGLRREPLPLSLTAPVPEAPGDPKPVTYDLLLEPGVNARDFVLQLREQDIDVVGSDRQKVRIRVTPGSGQASFIQSLQGIASSEEYVPPTLHNFFASQIMGLSRGADRQPTLPWTGKGQIVAVADTGLDATHPDFARCTKELVPLGRPGLTDDPHGHGTHVTGSILGDGTSSGGKHAGMAPGAALYFQSILGEPSAEDEFPLTGLPITLASLFEPAYQFGARIHNNSWGAIAAAHYRLHSQEVDEFVSQNRDMLIVISAGNEGTTLDPQAPEIRLADPGLVDWKSLAAPATSKNALTVGASRSSITTGGYAQFTHHQAWQDKFPPANPAVALDVSGELVSGNPDDLAGFSSRGPTDLLQIKPDVVAPGTDIVSTRTRSPEAPAKNFSGPLAGNKLYAHMCGTSMATPLVSGCAAIVREYYAEVHGLSQPSAALVKATLINGTRQLEGGHAKAPAGGFPNGHQGFGCIAMDSTLPHPAGRFALHFYDNWLTPSEHLKPGSFQDFSFRIAAATPGVWLRVCLAHTDAPGHGIQNALELWMQHQDDSLPPASSRKTNWYGNEDQQRSLRPSLSRPDRNNNISVIRPLNPLPGTYKIRVSVLNMLRGPSQDFALVVTGTGILDFKQH